MPPQRLVECAGVFVHKRGLLQHLPRDVLRELHQEFVVRPARFALPVGLFAQRGKTARQRVCIDLALRGALDAARGGQRCFLRDLPLVAAHVAHLAGKRLVQPAQALVLREQLRCVRGFVKEGIADIRVARIKSAHVVRGAFDLFGGENDILFIAVIHTIVAKLFEIFSRFFSSLVLALEPAQRPIGCALICRVLQIEVKWPHISSVTARIVLPRAEKTPLNVHF